MRLRLLSFLLSLLCVSALNAAPYRIIVIQTGEQANSHMLTNQGQKQAAALVGYLLGIPPDTPPLFSDLVSTDPKETPEHPITFIGAPSKLGAIQTVAPLANVIFSSKAPISIFTNMPETVQQFLPKRLHELKKTLLTSIHSGKTVVLSSQIRDIPSLLLELEPKLKKNRLFQTTFPLKTTGNYVFVITYDPSSSLFQVFTQPTNYKPVK